MLYLKKVYVAVGFKLQNHARASRGSGLVSSVTAMTIEKDLKASSRQSFATHHSQ